MKRPYLFAAGLVALIASATACHRKECATSTTNTTSATMTSGEAGLQTSASPAVPAATQPVLTPNDLPNAPSTAATGAAKGSTAAAPAPATATGPVDISGPTPAAPQTGGASGTSSANAGGATDNAPAGNAATSTTTTTGAPLVSPGLENEVSGGVGNTGAPLNYGLGGAAYDSWYGAPPAPKAPPVGGAMRPGAASDPNTTSGAR